MANPGTPTPALRTSGSRRSPSGTNTLFLVHPRYGRVSLALVRFLKNRGEL